MLAVIDSRSPNFAIDSLGKYSKDILLFESKGITYNSISCHPDIFMFKSGEDIVIAPNSPEMLPVFFEKYSIKYTVGTTIVDETLENSTAYNCLSSEKKMFHKFGYTDEKIKELSSDKEFINLPQAYTRCSMINLNDNACITSDKGILKISEQNIQNNFYFSPDEILIIDHKHGFFGGTCGIYKKMIFFNGNIHKHNDGKSLQNFINNMGFEPIFLHDDFLYDGGGIFLF